MKKKLSKLSFQEFQVAEKASPKIEFNGLVSPQNKKLETYEAFNFIELIRKWPDIIGDKFAEHTIPLKNTHQTLVILSDHSAFSHALSNMEVELKRKILVQFPKLSQSIKGLKFIVDAEHFKTQKVLIEKNIDKKPKFKQLHPYSPEFKKLTNDANELFKDITDEDLKKSFIALYFQLHS